MFWLNLNNDSISRLCNIPVSSMVGLQNLYKEEMLTIFRWCKTQSFGIEELDSLYHGVMYIIISSMEKVWWINSGVNVFCTLFVLFFILNLIKFFD